MGKESSTNGQDEIRLDNGTLNMWTTWIHHTNDAEEGKKIANYDSIH